MDEHGSGVVLRKDLQDLTNKMGVPRGTFRRWLSNAKRLAIFEQITKQNGDIILLISGAEKVAGILGCDNVGTQRVSMPVEKLFDDNWCSNVWAAFIVTLKGRPVSRRVMRDLTGVPERTQQDYEKEAKIKTTVNYAHDEGTTAGHLPGVREHERPNAFKWYDRKLKRDIVVWRCPDTRKAPKAYEYAGQGRSRKVNNRLSSLCTSCTHPNYSGIILDSNRRACDDFVVRLFHHDQDGAERAWKAYTKMDIPPYSDKAIHELYVRKPGGKGCSQWTVTH